MIVIPLQRLLSELEKLERIRWIAVEDERVSIENLMLDAITRSGLTVNGDHHYCRLFGLRRNQIAWSELEKLERARWIAVEDERVSIENLMLDALTRYGLTDDEDHDYCELFGLRRNQIAWSEVK